MQFDGACVCILAAALTSSAQTTNAPWAESVQKFNVSYTGSGYMDPKAFTGFLDHAEGRTATQSFYGRFSEDPVVFFKQWGLWRTLLLILLGGLALNLTPCVLPMIPVNLAIIGAGAQSESRKKGFALGSVYGLGIAAVYGVLGLAVVLGGARFGALNSSPWFNFGIAAVFLVLALSMFGVLHIDLSRFQSGLGGTQFKSRFAAAFFMGAQAASQDIAHISTAFRPKRFMTSPPPFPAALHPRAPLTLEFARAARSV